MDRRSRNQSCAEFERTAPVPLAFQALLCGLPIDVVGDTPGVERGALRYESRPHQSIQIGRGECRSRFYTSDLVHKALNRLIWADLSMGNDEASVIDYLRTALKDRSVKMTTLSAETNIPYRSLQNYFAKKSDMPVSVFIRICAVAHIPPEWPIHCNRAKLDTGLLKQALIDVCGELLPTIDDDESWALAPRPHNKKTSEAVRRDAGVIAALVESRYDIAMGRDIRHPRDDD